MRAARAGEVKVGAEVEQVPLPDPGTGADGARDAEGEVGGVGGPPVLTLRMNAQPLWQTEGAEGGVIARCPFHVTTSRPPAHREPQMKESNGLRIYPNPQTAEINRIPRRGDELGGGCR